MSCLYYTSTGTQNVVLPYYMGKSLFGLQWES